MKELLYKCPEPYPMPTKLEANGRYAKILLNDYSGIKSELTAINQYVYHHIMMEGCLEPAAEILRHIAIVEMKHLEMLGLCIRMLGVQPRYRFLSPSGAGYWNAGFVTYGRGDFKEMLELDLISELDAIKGYRRTLASIPEPQIQALIARIIQDEELHVQIFEELLKHM